MPSLGRFTLDSIRWSGPNALTCELTTDREGKVFQMYSGRHLVGVTRTIGERVLTGQVLPTRCPSPITIVMVDLVDRDTDFGARLPRRPWNVYRLGWNAASYPTDSQRFSIYGSDAPGESVNYTKQLLATQFAGDGTYKQPLPDMPLCGVWSYGIVPRDDALHGGNAGTLAEISIDVLIFPPDVLVQEDGSRLSVDVTAGVLTVGFEYDWPDA